MSQEKKLGVIGFPITHSKSPIIHHYWIKKYNLNGSYEALEIPPDDFTVRIHVLIEGGYTGFNVTIPHKESVMDLCDEIDDAATQIGAVNTLVIEDQKLIGKNTDAFGFIQNIKTTQMDFDFTQGAACVLGAGGAARAIIYALAQEKIPQIFLANRTADRAQALRQDFPNIPIEIIDWDKKESILPNANLLVNTTSLGMDGLTPLRIDIQGLPRTALVNDIVYTPLMTELLKNAQAQGHPFVTGIGMLLHQARPAFESWFGIMPEIDDALIKLVSE